MDTEKFRHIEQLMREMICMTSKIAFVLLVILNAMASQVNPLHSQTLRESNIDLEIVTANEWQKTTNVLGDIMDTETYCKNLGSPKKNKQELKEYFLDSVIIDSNTKSHYGIWQCSYEGKIKIFGKVWDFWSVSGLTRLSRKIDNMYKPKDNRFETYCEDTICYENIYLICSNVNCVPQSRASERDGNL